MLMLTLQADLDWLLDDSIADFEGSPQGHRTHTKWRQLKDHKRQTDAGAGTAQLRLDFDSLTAKWKRRVHDRMPLQYLTGSAHWRDLVLAVGPGVLIPRPETELLIDFAQEAMAKVPGGVDGVWADLGTGSGALSIALARCLSDKGRVFAVDASEEAAAWARLNVQRYKLDPRLQVLLGSWFEPLHAHQGQLSGVLCNPPYIASEVVPSLQAEVTRHEPWSALDGGKGTGSAMLLDICGAAVGMMQRGGFIALETGGDGQAEEVADFMSGLSDDVNGCSIPAYTDVITRKDLRGVPRFVTAYRAT
ncbi:S-adenosyl-L-methionine-dependent methyltransferase [Coccomyxa subellipsoidea C-169]|uniref:S-adenosyl-L-methionine-dependent methyltransferase n=1 Tax=Coccomyxa subellipsoidea (strain C-169) TaxID=574566 RepID=I0Z319_COCSC|nr:S-adenosyl-L-methionine-dependent methyltransferase [Coccomyxa subellipsoidea C-169]EIE25038.1 S-adenosyl-L-methionine-dependent methyltransferase [Coccomyxa subellipsoidea C-169]|eukprot:XP_005649582.1 S-adenosyl-L-methionine-dependent methyltransferase [Coccomyxa subellipsoidea C-169]